ncbi:oligopeptide:H+ symporter [Thiotrichales bacterium 19S3-7]|nr:oligopeptide:H+ symporter [Thiotrichales bacterium 19S3-7]MCF6801596.1 oligopeptide:H+ symporter [Thiotrichales bacterium 19S3-11]
MIKRVLNHPVALIICFLTEMWERYGFYVIQSLLALYLTSHLNLNDRYTYMLVGSFTALTYISPIAGGWIADRYLGQKKAVLVGAFVLFVSYLILAVNDSLDWLMLSLGGIAVGTGLLKPNVSSILGRQYKSGDPRRDSGFTIFYMGITTGIILGTVIPIKLSENFGWKFSFISAAFGLVIAFFVFFIGAKKFKLIDYAQIDGHSLLNLGYAIVGVILMWGLFYTVLMNSDFASIFFIIIVVFALGFVLSVAYREEGLQRRKTLAFLLLCIISVMFWSFYFQMFMSLTLFIRRAVEPTILGINFPPPYYVTIESIGMIVFGILLASLWGKMKQSNIALAAAVKFIISMTFMFLAYWLIWFSMQHSAHTLLLISPGLILMAYLTISMAELMLSPVGLAAVTHLSNYKVVSTMMGVFFVSLGAGGFLAGKLAGLASINQSQTNLIEIKANYIHAFTQLTYLSFAALIVTIGLAIMVYLLMKPYYPKRPHSVLSQMELAKYSA